jgi:YggT family protein
MQQLASILVLLLSLYSMAIIIRIILSWGGMGESRFGNFYRVIMRITDPYLSLFRNLPGMRRGMFDFSPIAAMIVLGIVQNVLSVFITRGSVSFGIVLALILQAVWSVISFFLILFTILSVVRIIFEYKPSGNSIQYIAILDNLLKGVQDRVHRLVFGGREIAMRTLLIGSALAPLAVYLGFRVLFQWLISYAAQLPF